MGSDSGRIVILEYNATKNSFDRVHMETFGEWTCNLSCDCFNHEIFILHIKYQFLLHFRQVRLPSDRARAVPGDRPEGEGRHDRRRREAEARLHPQQRFKRESHLCCFPSYKTSSCQIYFKSSEQYQLIINIYTP